MVQIKFEFNERGREITLILSFYITKRYIYSDHLIYNWNGFLPITMVLSE